MPAEGPAGVTPPRTHAIAPGNATRNERKSHDEGHPGGAPQTTKAVIVSGRPHALLSPDLHTRKPWLIKQNTLSAYESETCNWLVKIAIQPGHARKPQPA